MQYGDFPNLKEVKKILVIKLRHLGDVLLAGPVFRALKETFPDAQLDAYLYQEALPMLEGHPGVDQLIGYDRNWKQISLLTRLWKEAILLLNIRKGKYDLVINLTEGDRGIIAAGVSGAKIKAGVCPKGKWQKKILTHMGKICPSPRHMVERNLDVLRRIGIFPSLESRDLYFHIPQKARERAEALSRGSSYVMIHPTSRWKFKCWPIQKVKGLITQLLAERKTVVLTSGPAAEEREMAQEISGGLDVINLGGMISLKELGALIERSDLLICVDSAPFHIANALKKPVVALFGPTSEVTWGPWRNPHARVVSLKMSCRPCHLDGCGGSKRSDCLESISEEGVFQAIRSLAIGCSVSTNSLRESSLR